LPTLTSITPASTDGLSSIFNVNFTAASAPGTYQMVIAPSVADNMGHLVDQNGDGVSTSADTFTVNFAIAPNGLVGPDTFGYIASIANPPAATIVGRTGAFTILNNVDDSAAPVNLSGNTFNFYGINYAGNGKLWISSNGLITFGSSNTSPTNDNLASATLPTIAALWDDWTTGTGNPQVLALFDDTNGDGSPDRLIIEWNQVKHVGGAATDNGVSFQAILELNTGGRADNIGFKYLDANTNNDTCIK